MTPPTEKQPFSGSLSDPRTMRSLLEEAGFSFKKSLGQNFLINPTVCPRMAEAACGEAAGAPVGALEIGPGIGVLTAELCRRAERVVAIELDERLRPVLERTLGGFDNCQILFGDALRLDLHRILAERFAGMEVVVCANLPYYITSPLLMRLLESRLPVRSITVMVQKEAADRLCAPVGSRAAGAVTAAVAYYAEPELLFGVSAGSFLPAPRVDSAVLRLRIREKPPVEVADEAAFFALIKAAFAQRRKTLVNSVSSAGGIEKAALLAALEEIGLSPDVRAEKLTLSQLAALSNTLNGGGGIAEKQPV